MSNSGIIGKLKYLTGLEDEYVEEVEEIEEEEVEVPVKTGISKNNKVLNIHTHTNNNVKLVVYVPDKYDEVTKLVNDLKARKLVVLNLEHTPKEIKRKVFDFVNGAIYALEGNIQKISKDVFVVAPNNVEINANLKEELRGKGVFPWQKI